jgi:hypothetical protein
MDGKDAYRPTEEPTLPFQSPSATLAEVDPEPTLVPASTLPVTDDRVPAGYVIERELGRGGMGVVYLARQTRLDRPCALKMILAAEHAGAAQRERFETEAQAIARLQHDNIVRVYEIGEHHGQPFMALEFCAGGSLDRKLRDQQPTAREAATLVRALALGMQAAHEARVIHRDLKPGNVLLAADGTPKITDFGLAKKMDEDGATRTGSVLGTPSYMPPEQARGDSDLGPAVDIYALGAILYECLTARPPFKAATPMETLRQVLDNEPVALRQLNPAVPLDLETIAHRCLRKEPERRYATARELAEDLEHFLKGEPIRARPVGTLERALKWVQRNAVVTALGSVTVLVLLAGVIVASYFAMLAQGEAATARKAEDEATKQTGIARAKAAEAERQLKRSELGEYAGLLAQAQREFQLGNGMRALRLLESCQWNLRHVEFRQLWTRCNSKQTFRGHIGPVFCVAFSPDGKRIVSGGQDRMLKVWAADKGQELLSFPAPHRKVSSVAFSPDGTRVFGWDIAGKVLAWSATDGKPTDPGDPPPLPTPESACSPDGFLRAEPDGNNVAIFDPHRVAAANVWSLPDAVARKAYHSARAARAEQLKQWFAVSFHLSRILLDTPDDADLKRRRDEARQKPAAPKLLP